MPKPTNEQRQAAALTSRESFLSYVLSSAGGFYCVGKHHLQIMDALEAIERGDIKRLAVFMPPRHGKLCADSTPILTTNGWTTHGELRVGDFVFGSSGQPTPVVWTSEEDVADVEIEFTDGERIICHENHEWTVYDRSVGKWRTVETNYFMETTKFGKQRQVWSAVAGKSGRATYQLPQRQAFVLPERDLPVDPYVLGAWLGDGKSDSAQMCYAERDRIVREVCEERGYAVSSEWTHKTTGVKYVQFGYTGLQQSLRELDLIDNKHIPAEYKLSSLQQRLALLAGLIDTDGSVDASGRVRIATVSEKLASDIEDVVRSCGWRAGRYVQEACLSSSGIQGNAPCLYISFTPDTSIPTRVERKAIAGAEDCQRAIGIASVKRCEPEFDKCIAVAAKDGLYCVGRKMVLTHNSLAHDTPVNTPSGWRQHGDLETGDYVFSATGTPTQVVGVGPEVQCRSRVQMSNGEAIWAHENHEWPCFMGDDVFVSNVETRMFNTFGLENREVPIAVLPAVGPRSFVRGPHGILGSTFHAFNTQHPGRSIQVDDKRGVYLCGKTGLPTHNSELISIRFPAWYIGRNPNKRVIACSHTDRLAMRNSKKVRAQLGADSWPFKDVRLAWGSAGIANWDIGGYRGGYWAAGVRSAITGEGANLLLIDDPIKSRQEADSPTVRDALYSWFTDDAYTRLENDAAIILVLTRWHEDDLAGRILEQAGAGGQEWTLLRQPAIADPVTGEPADDTHKGVALWPEKYPLPRLLEIESDISQRAWLSEYQQQPSALKGTLFLRKWIQFYKELPKDAVQYTQTIDTAFKHEKSSDYSVVATWARTENAYYLVDLWRDKVPYPDLVTAVTAQYDKYQDKSPTIYIEDSASGQSLIQSLVRETRLPVVPWRSPGSKIAKAEGVTPHFQAGRVFVPYTPSWVGNWVEEHVRFPTAVHDDCVDTTAMALDILAGTAPGVLVMDKPDADKVSLSGKHTMSAYHSQRPGPLAGMGIERKARHAQRQRTTRPRP